MKKAPKTKISDFLPSTIIDEINIKLPRPSQSLKQLPFNNKNNLLSSSSNCTSSTNLSSNKYLMYPPKNCYKNCGLRKNYLSANQLPTQNMIFNHPQNVNSNFNSFTNFSFYPNSQMNQFYNSQQNLISQNPILLESQLDSISCITSIQNLTESINPQMLLDYIKTNKGSRHLQKIITTSPPSQFETDILVSILAPKISEVMCDCYGNYFLQKFFPYCSLIHRLLFYKYIQPSFFTIANNICGNHSLQCLIMLQNSKEEMNIIKDCVEKDLQDLSFMENSSYVIQKVVKAIKESNRDYINAFIISNLVDLCIDSNGICIVKEFIWGLENEFYIMAVASILELEINKLTYDQYGNFGIQEMLKKFGVLYCGKIMNKIVEHVFMYSISKFSSNVVDCVIRQLYKMDINGFCQVVMKIFFDEKCFNEMIKNKYATYVIENCLVLLFSPGRPELGQLQMNVYQLLSAKPFINEKKKIVQILNCYTTLF